MRTMMTSGQNKQKKLADSEIQQVLLATTDLPKSGSSQLHALTRLLGAVVCAATLAACTGGGEGSSSTSAEPSSSVQPPVSSAPSSAPISSAPSSATTASSTPSSSASSSSSTTQSSASSSLGGPPVTQHSDFTANAANGSVLYGQMCASCHGTNGEIGIDLSKYPTDNGLHRYLEDFMPKFVPGGSVTAADCVGQCAADITAFMAGWREVAAAFCSTERPVIYGERSLKLLTEREYANTVQDLFPNQQVPAEYLETWPDDYIGRFPNNLNANVVESRARAFMNNAQDIAEWAVQGNYLGSCDSASNCARNFINDFAYRAYRRPLTSGPDAAANETQQIRDLFDGAPTPRDGLRWAIITVLTSPNFLYRSELGIPVQQAIDEGFGNAGAVIVETDNGTFVPTGEDGLTVNAINFPEKSAGKPLTDDWGYLMSRNGAIKQRFRFSRPSIISVNAKANDHDGRWAKMRVVVNQREVGSVDVEGYDPQVFHFVYDGQEGEHDLFIRFENDSGGQPENTPGGDIDLHVGDVSVVPAQRQDGTTAPVEQVALEGLDKADPAAYVLTPFEYASALSYIYTGSTPDAELLEAARTGALNDAAEIEKQIGRLMATDAAEEHMKNFATTWMRTDRMHDPALFRRDNPAFTNEVRDAMIEELRTTFWYVYNNDSVPFSELYGADYIFANKVLADFYGIPWPGGNENEFLKINTTERGGLATMGAFLANWAHPKESSPILRAVNIRENMLCHHIDPPPGTELPPADSRAISDEVDRLTAAGELTTRKYYGILTTHPQCDSCHREDINPLGFGLENFDNIGLPRTTQEATGAPGANIAIDSMGTLFGPEIYKDHASSQTFNGAKELSKLLADSKATQECLTEKFFRLVVNRPIANTARDKLTSEAALSSSQELDYGCGHEQLNSVLEANNQNPKAAFKAMGQLDLIRFRR